MILPICRYTPKTLNPSKNSRQQPCFNAAEKQKKQPHRLSFLEVISFVGVMVLAEFLLERHLDAKSAKEAKQMASETANSIAEIDKALKDIENISMQPLNRIRKFPKGALRRMRKP